MKSEHPVTGLAVKQALTETLAYFDANEQAFRMSDLKTYVDAARLVERLLPGECEWCHGDGQLVRGNFNKGGEFYPCPHCQNGRVWDEGIVEVVVSAIAQARLSVAVQRPGISSVDEAPILARAVLSAIAQLAKAGSQ